MAAAGELGEAVAVAATDVLVVNGPADPGFEEEPLQAVSPAATTRATAQARLRDCIVAAPESAMTGD